MALVGCGYSADLDPCADGTCGPGCEGTRSITVDDESFTTPAGCVNLTLRAWGGGGGGAGAGADVGDEAGGGGGYATTSITLVGPAEIEVIIGFGGFGGVFEGTNGLAWYHGGGGGGGGGWFGGGGGGTGGVPERRLAGGGGGGSSYVGLGTGEVVAGFGYSAGNPDDFDRVYAGDGGRGDDGVTAARGSNGRVVVSWGP